jgi:hypothetical protein
MRRIKVPWALAYVTYPWIQSGVSCDPRSPDRVMRGMARPIPRDVQLFGRSTVSTTCMTPFFRMTSAIVTKALLPLASIISSLRPSYSKAISSWAI